jgi:hypothetical protein
MTALGVVRAESTPASVETFDQAFVEQTGGLCTLHLS